MKIFTIVFLLLSINLGAQSLPELIREYEEWCNETVLDTVMVGVTYELIDVPLLNESGDTIGYRVTHSNERLDPCPEYRDGDGTLYRISAPIKWDSWTVGNSTFKGSESREVICECKRRPVVPFGEGFWEWLKNYE